MVYHDVDALQATESNKKLAACNFDYMQYIKHEREIYSCPRKYIGRYTWVVLFQVRLYRRISVRCMYVLWFYQWHDL